ncbi:hypothetical protein UT300012_32160 [Paraclostridium bifermentans]
MGKQQAAVFNAIMKNYDTFKEIQEEFKNNQHIGSMEQENARYIDSIAGKLNELKVIWTDVFSDIFTQDFIKGGLDGLIAVSDVIRDLVSVTSELGITFPVLIGAFGGLSSVFKGMGAESKGFKQVQQGLSKMGIDAGDAAVMMGNLDSSNKKVAKSTKDVNTSTKGTSKVMGTIKSGVDKVGNSILNAGTHLKSFAIGFGKMALVTFAIQGVAKAFDYATSAVKDHNKEIQSSIEDTQETIKAEKEKIKYIDDTKDRYSELLKKQEEYSTSGKDLTQEQTAEMQELQDITQTLAEMFPELVIGYDENNGAILMSQDMEVLKQKSQETIDFQNKLLENQRKLLSESATDMMQDGEMFTRGVLPDLTYRTEEYKGAINNWRSGVLGGFKEVSQYEDNFLNSSGKKKMKHLDQYKKMTQEQQKDIDEYYSKALEATNQYYQYSSQIQQAAFDQISNTDVFKSLKGENLNQAKQFISSIDWGELDTAGQQKWIGATEKVLGLIQSGDPKIKKWSDSWNKANSEFKNTGDYEKYTKNLNGLAKELSTLTGVDFGTIMQGLTQVYTPLTQSEQEMQNFLSTYNKTRDDLLNGDPIAQALAKQFEGLDTLWDDLLTNENAYTIDGKLTYNMMVEIGNRKDIPKEISDLAKSFASDNNITEQETKIITDLVFTLKEGNTDEARKKLEEINKELAAHGREPIPMEVLTEVTGEEKVEDLTKKLDGLPKDTKTLVENEVVGEEDLETLKGLLNDSTLSDEKVVKVLMDNQDAITKAGGLKEWLDGIPSETWAKLGVKQENVEEAKQNLEEVSEKQEEVDSKESTIKVNGEETQGAIDDINSLIEHSSKLEDGIYKIDFETNVGDTVDKLNGVKEAVNGISKAFGSIPNKTINVETAQASKNITGLRNNIEQFNSMTGGVKTVKFNTDTATASKNVTGLRSNVSSYISSYCGKSYSTRFNTETAQASKNVTGLRSNVSSYVSSYGGKSYTTTFNVVTKYSTQGSPTPASGGAKPGKPKMGGSSIQRSSVAPQPQPTTPARATIMASPQGVGAANNPGVKATTPTMSALNTPRANIDISGGAIGSSVKYNVEMLQEMINQVKQLEHEFNKLDNAIDNAVGTQKMELLRKQNELLEKQKNSQKELLGYLNKQQAYYKNFLRNKGFNFDGSGNLTNYEEKLISMEKHLDSLKKKSEDAQKAYSDYQGDNEGYKKNLESSSKSAQDAYDKEKEKIDEVKDYLNAYMSVTFDKMPNANEEWDSLNNKIQENLDAMKKFEKLKWTTQKELRWKQLELNISKVTNELDKLEVQLKYAFGKDKIDLMNKQIDLLKKQQKELKESLTYLTSTRNELKNKLSDHGFKFNPDGNISNLETQMEHLLNTSKDYEDVKEILESYFDLVGKEIPDLENDILDLNNAIKDTQKEQLEVTKDVQDKIMDIYKKDVDERIKLIEKERDKRLKALKEEQDTYNDARKEVDYQNDYDDQLKKIQELQKKYDDLSGDNSLGNKKKLEDLMKQIEEEKKKLEDLVSDHIDDSVNDMYDKESDRIESESDKKIEDLEDKYSDEKLQEIVNKVLGTGVFEDIDGNLRSLQDVMLDYIDDYEDGLMATGELIKSEWIANLEVARDTIKEIADINSSMGIDKYSQGRMATFSGNRSSNSINFHGNLINIEGNVDKDVVDDLKNLEDSMVRKITSEIMSKVDGR